jgi:Protein of unknown function (DUF2971)
MSEIDRSQFHPLHLDSADRFVYRYRTAKRALKEIEKKKVRMSPFPELNDPKEFADWDFDLHASQEFPNPNWQKPQEEASAYAKNCAKVLCATLDDKSALDRTNIDSIWARGFSRPRMWQQYAENYCSACMVFDRAALDAAIRSSVPKGSKLIGRNIRYINTSRLRINHSLLNPFMLNYDRIHNVGMAQAMAEHVERHMQMLFFDKASDWQTEKEYRWLIWDTEHKELFIKFGNALKAVVIGENKFATAPDQQKMPTPEEISIALDNLHERCARLNVTVWEMRWRNGAPGVVPVALRR